MTSEFLPTQNPWRSREQIIRAVETLPPLPAIALRVMQVAQDPNSSAADLAVVVSSDPGLSARVLRVANSAAYRRQRDITSVQEALVMLGFLQARNIAISSAITGAYAPDALNVLFRIKEFWRHSMAVAFRASDLAGHSRRIDVPSAFTAGILHNMGRLAMFYADPAGVDQAVAEAIVEEVPLESVERGLLGYDHAEIGGLLAAKWRLPLPIQEAIQQHHVDDQPATTIASVVAAADRFATDHGVLPGYIIPGAPSVEPDSEEFRRLMKQVKSLMQLVVGEPVGVKLAS